ncbi:hypothetical protein O9557_23130 [Achromobacter ruhlandii]|nr:hypothetical protein [Achromobacter ruhlandii]MCZ8398802.1 hypothetical protein [Achromobacter ruhlandii]
MPSVLATRLAPAIRRLGDELITASRGGRLVGGQALDQLHAIQLGHEQVAQHQIVALLFQQAQGMTAVLGGFDVRDAGLEKQASQVFALQ